MTTPDSSIFTELHTFIAFGTELTQQEGIAAYGLIEDSIDQHIPPETLEQTARCIGCTSLELNLDKLL